MGLPQLRRQPGALDDDLMVVGGGLFAQRGGVAALRGDDFLAPGEPGGESDVEESGDELVLLSAAADGDLLA